MHEAIKKKLKVRGDGIDLTRVYLDGLKLKDLDFSGCTGQLFFGRSMKLERPDFRSCRMWSAFLLKSEIKHGNFDDAVMPMGHFWYINAYRCTFRNADLSHADFTAARLTRCNFEGATLRGANFRGAIITDCRGLDNVKGW